MLATSVDKYRYLVAPCCSLFRWCNDVQMILWRFLRAQAKLYGGKLPCWLIPLLHPRTRPNQKGFSGAKKRVLWTCRVILHILVWKKALLGSWNGTFPQLSVHRIAESLKWKRPTLRVPSHFKWRLILGQRRLPECWFAPGRQKGAMLAIHCYVPWKSHKYLYGQTLSVFRSSLRLMQETHEVWKCL